MSSTTAKLVFVNSETPLPKWLLATIVCFLGAMFYLYEFILQVSPAVITTQLMHDLRLNAASLGVMAAFYYYAYTPMQIFAGLLYDRFGPRILITLAILVCASGAFFFGLTHSFGLAAAGRFLMGIGSAFSFIGALLLISRWFPPQYFATLAGIVQFMSSMGAVLGEEPLAAVIVHHGWRHALIGIAFIGILLATLVWLVVRDNPEGKSVHCNTKVKSSRQRLKEILRNQQTWLIAAYTFLIWAPITVFAALWGIPFLVVTYGVSVKTASAACSMIWFGIGIGSPLIGWWSDKIQQRCLPLAACALLGATVTTLIVYTTTLPHSLLFAVLFIFGLASSGQSLAFGVVKDINHSSVVGTAIGFNNMACVAGGALLQPLVGLLLKFNWDGTLQTGVPFYASSDYRIALVLLPLCYVVAAIIARFFLRETRCKMVVPSEPESPLVYSAS